MRQLKRVIIKEEFVELTGDHIKALILNQFLYWTERVKGFDRFIQEERSRAEKEDIEINVSESRGWIYKTADDLSDELMLNLSSDTIDKHVRSLVEMKYLLERKSPTYKWDKKHQYQVNLVKLNSDLMKLGFPLQEWG